MRFIKKNRKNGKNKISSNEANSDKLELFERMCNSTNDIIREVQSKMQKINIDIFELYEKDMNKVHSIDSELKKFTIQLVQNLRKIFNKEDLLC